MRQNLWPNALAKLCGVAIELILGNALTKFVLSNTMKEKSKTRYENHIP